MLEEEERCRQLHVEQNRLENVVKILEGKRYNEGSQKIDKLIEEREGMIDGKGWVEELEGGLQEIKQVHQEFVDQEINLNLYQTHYNQAVMKIDEALGILDASNFKKTSEKVKAIDSKISNLEKAIAQLLAEAGVSKEDILEAKFAKQKMSQVKKEIDESEKRQEVLNARIHYDFENIQIKSKEYETQVKHAMSPLRQTLQENITSRSTGEIKNIEIEYCFDEKKAWEKIAQEFYQFAT